MEARRALFRIFKSGDSTDTRDKPIEEGMSALQKILDNPEQRRKFGEFLQSEHSYENLEFWQAVQERLKTMEELELQNLKSSDRIQEAVHLTHQILEKYIAHGATQQVPDCYCIKVVFKFNPLVLVKKLYNHSATMRISNFDKLCKSA